MEMGDDKVADFLTEATMEYRHTSTLHLEELHNLITIINTPPRHASDTSGADLGRDIEPIGQLEWRNYWVRVGEREGAMRIDAALRSMENVLEKSKKKIRLRALHLEKIRLGVPVTPVEDDSSSAGA